LKYLLLNLAASDDTAGFDESGQRTHRWLLSIEEIEPDRRIDMRLTLCDIGGWEAHGR